MLLLAVLFSTYRRRRLRQIAQQPTWPSSNLQQAQNTASQPQTQPLTAASISANTVSNLRPCESIVPNNQSPSIPVATASNPQAPSTGSNLAAPSTAPSSTIRQSVPTSVVAPSSARNNFIGYYDRSAIIDIHNKERASVGNPPIAWDFKMEAASLSCMAKNNPTTLIPSLCSDDNLLRNAGENIANSGNATFVSQLFINEKCYITDSTKLTSPGNYTFDSTIGHYTQAIWKQSTRMSCVQIAVNGVIYCHYLERGNVPLVNESVLNAKPDRSRCPTPFP